MIACYLSKHLFHWNSISESWLTAPQSLIMLEIVFAMFSIAQSKYATGWAKTTIAIPLQLLHLCMADRSKKYEASAAFRHIPHHRHLQDDGLKRNQMTTHFYGIIMQALQHSTLSSEIVTPVHNCGISAADIIALMSSFWEHNR